MRKFLIIPVATIGLLGIVYEIISTWQALPDDLIIKSLFFPGVVYIFLLGIWFAQKSHKNNDSEDESK